MHGKGVFPLLAQRALRPALKRGLLRELFTTPPPPTATALAKALACADADTLHTVLESLPPNAKKRAGLQWAMAELEGEFTKADKNADGKLSYKEFRAWAEEVISTGKPTEPETPPTAAQLRATFYINAVPFIAVGLTDNSLMILSGDIIDHSIGLLLGLSTLGAAALGNGVASALGMVSHGAIERSASAIGLPDPRLTLYQRELQVTKNVRMGAGIVGVLLGCILGMFPLLFLNAPSSHDPKLEREVQTKDSQAQEAQEAKRHTA